MLTVKKSNHKIRSRDLLLTLMCYAFMCSWNLRSPYWEQQINVLIGKENYNRNRVESVCIIWRMDVVARVDKRFDSSTILRLSAFFHPDWLQWLY